MITLYENKNIRVVNGEVKGIKELRGLSTDEKPTAGIDNGSVFIEIDTGKVFMFDLKNAEWKEI